MNAFEKFTQSAEENEQVKNIESLEDAQKRMVAIEDGELPANQPLGEIFRRITHELMKNLAKTQGKDYSIESSAE